MADGVERVEGFGGVFFKGAEEVGTSGSAGKEKRRKSEQVEGDVEGEGEVECMERGGIVLHVPIKGCGEPGLWILYRAASLGSIRLMENISAAACQVSGRAERCCRYLLNHVRVACGYISL